MGSIIGGVAQGVGSYLGAQAEAQAAEKATAAAQTGYNYLTSGAGAGAASNYINTGSNALNTQAGVQGDIAGLLGVGGQAANGEAFKNYANSLGYRFQLQQGTGAINANAASQGLLDSGANAKALTAYGQNLASTTFNNYLTQMGGLNASLGATAQQGQNMLGTIGSVGTASGGNAANAIMAGGAAQGNFFSGLGGAAGNMFSQVGGLGGGTFGLPAASGYSGSLGDDTLGLANGGIYSGQVGLGSPGQTMPSAGGGTSIL